MNGSKTQIALVQASVALPIMILALLSGAIADNVPRRTVMLASQIYMFVVSIILCLCAWFGLLSPWMLLGFTFLIGCGTAINAPSWQATVGDIVPRATIPAAVSMNSMGFNIARTAGPAMGGMIVAAFGAAAAFTVNVFTYVGLIYVLFKWRPEDYARPSLREDLRTAMAAGVRYVSLSSPIRRVMMRAAVFGVAASAVPSLLPLVADELIGGNAITFGLLSGAFGVGAVIGALMSRRIRDQFSNEMTMRIALVVMIIGAVIVARSPWLGLTMAGMVVFGSAWLLTMAMMNVAVQMSAPRWVVGRALSLYQMSVFGAMAAGSWISGTLSEQFGVADALLLMAAVQSVSLFVGLFAPLPETDHLDLELVGRWRVPNVEVPIEPRAGPVHITIQYRILESDIPKFLTAMNHHRGARRRDGARDWSLLRDLSDPEVWIEKYRFPRWLDYVLHNERRTKEDDADIDTLRGLHRGSWPPPIQSMLQRQVNTVSLNPNLAADTTNDPTRTN